MALMAPSWVAGQGPFPSQVSLSQNLQQEWIRPEIWRETTWLQVLGGLGAFEKVTDALRASTASRAKWEA